MERIPAEGGPPLQPAFRERNVAPQALSQDEVDLAKRVISTARNLEDQLAQSQSSQLRARIRLPKWLSQLMGIQEKERLGSLTPQRQTRAQESPIPASKSLHEEAREQKLFYNRLADMPNEEIHAIKQQYGSSVTREFLWEVAHKQPDVFFANVKQRAAFHCDMNLLEKTEGVTEAEAQKLLDQYLQGDRTAVIQLIKTRSQDFITNLQSKIIDYQNKLKDYLEKTDNLISKQVIQNSLNQMQTVLVELKFIQNRQLDIFDKRIQSALKSENPNQELAKVVSELQEKIFSLNKRNDQAKQAATDCKLIAIIKALFSKPAATVDTASKEDLAMLSEQITHRVEMAYTGAEKHAKADEIVANFFKLLSPDLDQAKMKTNFEKIINKNYSGPLEEYLKEQQSSIVRTIQEGMANDKTFETSQDKALRYTEKVIDNLMAEKNMLKQDPLGLARTIASTKKELIKHLVLKTDQEKAAFKQALHDNPEFIEKAIYQKWIVGPLSELMMDKVTSIPAVKAMIK